MRNKSILFLALSATFSMGYAQKKTLDDSVYDQWQNISSPFISKDGQMVLYQINVQEGDGNLYLKSKKNVSLLTLPRGYNGSLTMDNATLVAMIKPSFKETREARIKKKKPDEFPKDSLAILMTKTGELKKYANVKSYDMPRDNSNFMAFLYDKEIKEIRKADSTQKQDSVKNIKPSASKKPKTIQTLVLYNLKSNDTLHISHVDKYVFSNDGKSLLYVRKQEEKDSTAHYGGVYVRNLTNGTSKKITSAKAEFKNFKFDDKGSQITYLGDHSKKNALIKDVKLYYYNPSKDTATVIDPKSISGIPQNWLISGDASPRFNHAGSQLYFGIAPVPAVKDTSLVDFEQAKLDIWSWNDDFIQPQQLAGLDSELKKNYLTVINLNSPQVAIPLLDEDKDNLLSFRTKNPAYILVGSTTGRRIEYQWEGQMKQDVYLVSTSDGRKKLIIEKFSGRMYLSPDQQKVVFFNNETSNWYVYDIKSSQTIQLNTSTTVSFADEENDSPTTPGSYGMAAWANDQKGVYLNSRYDIWYFSFDGKEHYSLTKEYGKKSKTVFRLVDLTRPEEEDRTFYYYPKTGSLLSAFSEVNKYNGFYTVKGKSEEPQKIMLTPNVYRTTLASEDKKTLLFTKEDYANSPDLFTTSDLFKNQLGLTHTNPQQNQYNWMTAELIHWKTPQGHDAEGILYKPEDFNSSKKYPVIAYFYEKLSEDLYAYQAPAPTPSRLNIPFFVSNDYLVFAPDIQYTIGHPGKSAEEYINSGMRYLAQNNWVDSTKMGIQGQSWGGYQVAHLITTTHMYAAAWTGAPVVNMTSAYGGIRWQSGMSRQFQYEHTQSRIGATLWEKPDLYIENSPLFQLPNVTTPVVIMANDNDGAVPWYQGIEMFMGLRRLNKPVWLLNYNGDEHNLMKRPNRKDIQIREQQFFDHYLKGKPAPRWMTTGVPAKLKGIDWGLNTENK